MSQPTEINNSYWVFHGAISHKELKDIGKWMLFYPKQMLDIKWKEICSLYDNNKLSGVISMKCSTGLNNERAMNKSNGVIILYCNNSGNERNIIDIGKKLVPYIQDYPGRCIYYKTDLQTINGTGATGVEMNYTYTLNIKDENDCDHFLFKFT